MRRHLASAAAIAALTLGAISAGATAATAADGDPVEAGIVVEKVAGLPADFMNGVDVSSVIALEKSGVIFRNDDGTQGDPFEILAAHGITDVRIRVWNDPFNDDGKGYGGGTVDAARAVAIGERATAAGLHVTVDFHYADFWAHPGQQPAPKAWAGMTTEEKATATHTFTLETLQAMAAAGVDVTMVQVGNETNGALIAGESGWPAFVQIAGAGSAAVRDVYPDALVAVHFTDPQSTDYWSIAQALETNGLDYDVFASSYYPYWHGTLANLTDKLYWVANDFGKQVLVAETSYAYTLADGDGHENTVRAGANDSGPYPISVQGQATAVRDVIEAVVNVGDAGIGVFYWEPAWLPVGPPEDVALNQAKWEKYGSGWAASFAGEYSSDAAQYYGGSSWDNQALFGFDGKPLESLNVFSYARTGAIAPLEVTSVGKPTVTITEGETLSMPATVTVTYNDGSSEEQDVTWSDSVSGITSVGTYTVSGVTSEGLSTTAKVVVKAENLLVNPGFETGSTDPWWVYATNWPSQGWISDSTPAAVTGTWGFNYWDGAGGKDITVEQEVTGLDPGTYQASMRAHGFDGDELEFYATSEGVRTPVTVGLTGYQAYKTPTVTFEVGASGTALVGFTTQIGAGDWGWIDDFTLRHAPTPGADTTALQAAVDAAHAIDRDAYVPDSLVPLDAALEQAAIVLAAEAPTQQQVDDALAALQTAMAGLEVEGEGTVPAVTPVTVTVAEGEAITLPETVTVTYYDGSQEQQSVTWSDAVTWISSTGTYVVPGTTSAGLEAKAIVVVTVKNWVINPSFEDDDLSMWTITNAAVATTGDSADQYRSVDLWAADPRVVTIEQTITGLPEGQYRLSATSQGEIGAGDTATVDLTSGAVTARANLPFNGWQAWLPAKTVAVSVGADGIATVGATLDLSGGAWGTVDDFRLVRTGGVAVDLSALEAKVAQSSAIDTAPFTAESVTALRAALAIARVVLQADYPTQTQVDDALAGLSAAIAGLDDGVVEPAPVLTCEVGSVRAGGWVTVHLSGMPGSQVEVGIASVYRALTTVPVVNGAATATVRIPADLAPGVHHLQARDASGAVLAEFEIEVLAADELSGTGADVAGAITAALGLVGAGAVLAFAAARRRTRTP